MKNDAIPAAAQHIGLRVQQVAAAATSRSEMRVFVFILLLATILNSTGHLEENAIIDITSAIHLNKTIQDNEHVLIAFMRRGCSKARALHPNLKWAASRMMEESVEARIAIVDLLELSDEAEKMSATFGVSDTPALKWIVRGAVSDYHGQFSANGIFEWIHG